MIRERSTRTPGNEETVLRIAKDYPSTRTRAIGEQVGFTQSTAWKILAAKQMSAYYLQGAHSLELKDYPLRMPFVTWSATDSFRLRICCVPFIYG